MRDSRFYDDDINSEDRKTERLYRLEQKVDRLSKANPKVKKTSVAKTVYVSGGSSSEAGAAGPHALSGLDSPHTGTLSDSQAPQFLKTDGSRILTGSLTVNPRVTIDGVDLDVLETTVEEHKGPTSDDHQQYAASVLATFNRDAKIAMFARDIDYEKTYTWDGVHTFNNIVIINGPLGLGSDQLVLNNDGTNVDIELKFHRDIGGDFSIFWNGVIGWTTKPFRPSDLIINRISATEPVAPMAGMVWLDPS